MASEREERTATYGFLAGVVGGIAGTWAMNEAQRAWTRAFDSCPPVSAGGKHDARDWQERSEGQNSNELAAQAVSRAVAARSLSEGELAVAAPLVHFVFGAAVAGGYGVWAADSARTRSVRNGAGFGIAVWLLADILGMPLTGLSRLTTERPLEMHLQSLAAHLVYGVTAEVVRHRALMSMERPAADSNTP